MVAQICNCRYMEIWGQDSKFKVFIDYRVSSTSAQSYLEKPYLKQKELKIQALT